MIVRRIFSVSALILLAALISACSGESGVDEKVRYERALNAWQAGDARAAVIDLKSILQQNPASADARFLMGKIHVRLGFGPDAEKELRRALESGVSREEVLPYLGRALLLQKRSDELFKEISVESAQKDAELLALQGEAYLMMGAEQDADDSISKALALESGNREILLSAAKLALTKRNILTAREYLEEVLTLDNTSSLAWFLRGGIDFMAGRLEESEKAFLHAIEHEPAKMTTHLYFLANASLARTHLTQGRHQDALVRIDDVLLKIAPKHPLPNYLRALVSYQSDEYEAAEKSLRKVLKSAPNDSGSILLLGAVSYYQGKFEQANAYLIDFIAMMPGYVPARKLLAATRVKLRQPEGALDVLKPALTQTPDDAQLLELIGGIALQLGDSKGARQYLSRALKESPENADVRAKLASVHMMEGNIDFAISGLEERGTGVVGTEKEELVLAVAYMHKNELNKARDLIEGVLSEEPNSAPAYQLLARLAELDGDEKQSFQHYKKALELRPDNVNLALVVARNEIGAGAVDEGRELLDRILTLEPDHMAAMVMMAYLEAQLNRWDEALALAKRLSHRESRAAAGLELEGNLFMLKKDYQRAFSSYDSAIKVDESELVVLKRYRAEKTIDGKSAITSLERWVEANPALTQARIVLATEYMAEDRIDEAKIHFEHVLQERPDMPVALNNLAWLYLEEGDARAISLARRAYEIQPKSADILDTYGWSMVKLGDKKQGTAMLEKAFELAPDNAAIRQHLQLARN